MVESQFPFRQRNARAIVDTVLLHSTAVPDLNATMAVLSKRGLSYHFLVDRDGVTVQLVDPMFVAFHAGDSNGPQGPACNEYSVGISFVNLNDGVDPYTKAQLASLTSLVDLLRIQIPTLRFLTTHQAVSAPRKDDPRNFPIQQCAELCGLEIWTRSGVPVVIP